MKLKLIRLNKYRKRGIQRRNIRIRANQKSEDRILWKDVVVPLLAAIMVVLIQQLFFEENKKVESDIDFKMARLREQLPTLNRIMVFTDEYSISYTKIIATPVQIKELINTATGEIISSKEVELQDQSDTTILVVPSFVSSKISRDKFTADLEAINTGRNLLDYHIYLRLERVMDFLLENPLPPVDNHEQMLKSNWSKSETQKEWRKLMDSAFEVSYNTIYHPEIKYKVVRQ